MAYRFAGVEIDSSVAISGLRQDAGGTGTSGLPLAIRQEPGPPPVPDRVLVTMKGRYETRLGTLGDDWLLDSKFDGAFLIDPSLRTLRLYSERQPPSAVCCDVLVRRVLPRLMSARGAVTLHAASLATRDGGLLLLGASGAGKSTTTAALAAMPGWDVLSDDLSTLWPGDPPTIAPSGAGICIWQASLHGLGLDPTRCTPMPGYDGKFRFDPSDAPANPPVPVRAFVFLSREAGLETPMLSPVSRIEALSLAARQIVLFNPAAPATDELAGVVARLTALAATVKMVRLSYPSRYDVLPAVADLLTGLAAE